MNFVDAKKLEKVKLVLENSRTILQEIRNSEEDDSTAQTLQDSLDSLKSAQSSLEELES